MRNPLSPFRIRFSTAHAALAGALAPVLILLFVDTRYQWWGIGAVTAVVVLALITFRGRRFSGWAGAFFAWFWRRRRPPAAPSEPVVGATVMPGDHVAVRWQGPVMVALIELVPRPFTPTVIVDGTVHTDDVVHTRLVQDLLSVHCPDLEADVVSAGYRVGAGASARAVELYERVIGSDPAPAHRRTWIMLRADPARTRRSAQRRDAGVPGLARYLVSATTRMADALAGHGVDALCERSFDDYDQATEVRFDRERWSKLKGPNGFTAAYTAPGGPDVWWSVPAARTITRARVAPGEAPRSTVVLTTAAKSKKPKGFTRISGAQRAALAGQTLVADRHHQLPIGSAGVLVGQTVSKYPVYMPFDDVDVIVAVEDPATLATFAVRAAAAGGTVTLAPQFRELADRIGAQVGPEAKVAWPHATSYLGSHPGVDRVVLRPNLIGTPRHRQLPIRPLTSAGEDRVEMAVPR